MRYVVWFIFHFLCIASSVIFAQKGTNSVYRHQFTLTTDNDVYLAAFKDGYYTNGLFLNWHSRIASSKQKTIRHYQIGQTIFTPRSRTYYRLYGIDRPYCGYLYAQYGQSHFFPSNTSWQWSVQIGTVGPNSLGKLFQEQYHKIFGFQYFKGWEKQIGNEVGINLSAQYRCTPWKPLAKMQIVPYQGATLGTTFVNACAGAICCIGNFKTSTTSRLFNAHVGNNATENAGKECFFYWQPQITLAGYNATIQGGLFTKYQQAVIKQLQPWLYQQNWGFVYSKGRYTVKAEVVYQSKEAIQQAAPQRYGSIHFSFLY